MDSQQYLKDIKIFRNFLFQKVNLKISVDRYISRPSQFSYNFSQKFYAAEA